MRSIKNLRMAGLILAAVAAMFIPTQAMAAGTASGTSIANSATLDYQVGGSDQAQLTSNITTFVVDNKVDLTVAELGSANVIPNTSDNVLVFSVTNTGNTDQGYSLSVTGGGSDDFDMNNVRIYLDVNNDGLLDGGDTSYTLGTRVADIVSDAAIQILVVADTPGGAGAPTNGQTAVYNLIATTLNAGTTTVTPNNDGDADDPTLIQVVWADGAGTDDAANDGKHSADAIFTVSTASLTVNKSQAVVSDPFNGTTNPKAIPGATIRYTIAVTNAAGAAEATNVVLVDASPTNTTYAPGTITLNAAVLTDINGDDAGDYGATNAGAVTVNIPSILQNTTSTVTFDVTIN